MYQIIITRRSGIVINAGIPIYDYKEAVEAFLTECHRYITGFHDYDEEDITSVVQQGYERNPLSDTVINLVEVRDQQGKIKNLSGSSQQAINKAQVIHQILALKRSRKSA